MLTNKYVTHQSGCPSFVPTTNSYRYRHCVYSRTVYAVSDPNVSLKYIPDHYVQLRTLSYDHIYEAAILVKRPLSPSFLPLEEKNNCALVAKIIIYDQQLFPFSVYCRPSLINLKAFLLNLSRSFTAAITSRSILCFDANSRNPLWNSNLLDNKGIIFEDLCRLPGLSVAINTTLCYQNHHPPNSTFPDITVLEIW